MNTRALFIVVLGLVCAATAAHARDDRLRFPLGNALNTSEAKSKLDPRIHLYFGKTAYPAPKQRSGTFKANKKTNFFNKSDQDGCNWAFLSAALSLQERTRQLGGNAVVNIVSIYKDREFSSETEYECGAGSVVGGVALRGEIVTLP